MQEYIKIILSIIPPDGELLEVRYFFFFTFLYLIPGVISYTYEVFNTQCLMSKKI